MASAKCFVQFGQLVIELPVFGPLILRQAVGPFEFLEVDQIFLVVELNVVDELEQARVHAA